MIRSLYRLTLRLHPARFRREFAEEMLWIFDQPSERGRRERLLADGLLSLARQWTVRGDLRDLAVAAEAAPGLADGVPAFRMVQPLDIRPGTLVKGGLLAMANILVVGLVIGAGGKRTASNRTITLRQGEAVASALLSRDGHVAPAPPEEARLLDSRQEVRTRAPRNPPHEQPGVFGGEEEAPQGPAAPGAALDLSYLFSRPVVGSAIQPGPLSQQRYAEYFSILLVLRTLDANRDLTLSAEEIQSAPDRLPSLDVDHDGRLDARECGIDLRQGLDRAFVANATRAFMSFHAAHRALDANRDGVISADEIRESSHRLEALDTNGDGGLDGEELLPDPVESQVALVLRLDGNWDGEIRADERAGPYAQGLRDFLAAADRNRDGAVTAEEARVEVRRRADLDDDGAVTREELLQAQSGGAFDRR